MAAVPGQDPLNTSNVEPESTPPAPETSRDRRSVFRGSTVLTLLLLLALWANVCRFLSGEWSAREQYNYGWFVPFFALLLFWLRWEKRPLPLPPSSSSRLWAWLLIGLPAFLLQFPLRLFEVANPDWRLLGWIHTLAVATITVLIIWSAGGKVWASYFSFPIAFFFVAVPWILAIETPIVQGLMRLVAMVAAESLTLFGVPTQLEGSLIRVSTGIVGVNEACSGVRSLQTSLMIGLLFGELQRLSAWRRALLVLGALLIALVGNFGRAFFLVWVAATENISATEGWHDVAGYSILGAVFVGSLLLAKWLSGPAEKETPDADTVPSLPPIRSLSGGVLVTALCWLLVSEIAVEGWYRSHERNRQPAPKWSVTWPKSAPEFRDIPVTEGMKTNLQFDRARAAAWSLPDQAGVDQAPRCVMFFIRWEPGSSTILRARAHRPDVCLPNTGWRATDAAPIRRYSIAENYALPFHRFGFIRDAAEQAPLYAHAFFCMGEDFVDPERKNPFELPSYIPTPWVTSDRIKVVRDGLRNPGQQVVELIMITSQPMEAADAEARFAEMLPSLVQVGGDNVSLSSAR